MVSPKSQGSDISLRSVRDGKTRHTAANGEQRYPQASGAQVPEWHVFWVESNKSVIIRAVGGHRCGEGF